MIPLDAQIRMAEHLKSAGWSVIPPYRYRTRLDARGMPKPHRTPEPVDEETYKKLTKSKERELTRLRGTNKHQILKALSSTVMSTKELLDSGLSGGVSSRLTELRLDGYVASARPTDWVDHRTKRYILTDKGRELLADLERKTNG